MCYPGGLAAYDHQGLRYIQRRSSDTQGGQIYNIYRSGVHIHRRGGADYDVYRKGVQIPRGALNVSSVLSGAQHTALRRNPRNADTAEEGTKDSFELSKTRLPDVVLSTQATTNFALGRTNLIIPYILKLNF